MVQPEVSIGLPVFNGAAHLDAALRSIRDQSYEDFEVIVSDNCSTDATPEIAERHAAEDSRIRLVRQPVNAGAVPNFNDVFRHARGQYFKWAAHDDVLHPEYLRACVRALELTPAAVLAFPRAEVIDEDGRVLDRYDVTLPTDSPSARRRFRMLLLSWHRCYEIFGLVRTRALSRTRLMDTFWGSDRTLLQELALQGPFVEVPRYLFYPRRHATQSVTAMRGDDVARTYWLDVRAQGRMVFPAWRVVSGNLRAIRRAPVGLPDKARMCGDVGAWARRHWPELARDVARATRQGARRPVSGVRFMRR